MHPGLASLTQDILHAWLALANVQSEQNAKVEQLISDYDICFGGHYQLISKINRHNKKQLVVRLAGLQFLVLQ